MKSYAFQFNADTVKAKRLQIKDGQSVPIDYVGTTSDLPFSRFQPNDELFIVALSDKRIQLLGRMVVGSAPMLREAAVQKTGRNDFLEDKELICLADPAQVSFFRTDLTVPLDVARGLELFTSKERETNVSSLKADKPDPNLFRACPRLSPDSALSLRRLLGLHDQDIFEDDAAETPEPIGSDNEAYRIQAIKTRRGQAAFRRNLIAAYRGCCVITKCVVEELLEAAHITTHAELTDYRVSNGLLMRADIHTLFDMSLIAIDERYQIVVSPTIRHSEYWTYNGRTLSHLPDKSSDQPNREALTKRAAVLKR